MGAQAVEARSPGRPRDGRLDAAIAQAALEVVLERGYHRASVSEVARRARVGTPAVYRRWPTKLAMGLDLFERSAGDRPIPETESIRDDLVRFLRGRIRLFRSAAFQQLIIPLFEERMEDGQVADKLAARLAAYRRPLMARIDRSIAAGELRPVDPALLLDLLSGPVIIRLLFGQPMPRLSDAEAIVDQVLAGVAAGKAPRRS